MYEDVVKALRMCGYPVSYYWCSHGCCFAVDGSTCRMGPMISAAASAIEDLNERLHDYRAAYDRTVKDDYGAAAAGEIPVGSLAREDGEE